MFETPGFWSKAHPGARQVIAGTAIAVAMFAAAPGLLTWSARDWTNGEPAGNEILESDLHPVPPPAHRIWIDSDAACGAGATVDPDDCLAILYLAARPDIEIAGISSVFGNATLDITDRTLRSLVSRLGDQDAAPLALYRGAAVGYSNHRSGKPAAGSTDAERALADALNDGPLTILALGPLANIAAVLTTRPDLHSNIERIIAVMGRREGHVFHPSEGSRAAGLLGHGPVFRDFNVAMDPAAVASVLAARVPVTLAPYELGRDIEITAADLARLAASGPLGGWVAARAGPWLDYWNEVVGRDGFYPFDLVAAILAVEPQRFVCASVTAELGREAVVSPPFLRAPVLNVRPRAADQSAAPPIGYCHTLRPDAARAVARADGAADIGP